MKLEKSTLEFLKQLRENNNKPWFNDHKDRYVVAKENFKNFVLSLQQELEKTDSIEGHKIFRIYRDVRFSKDKTPYKSSMSVGFTRATNRLRGGYYFHFEPGSIFVGGGFWAPNKDDLKRIRDEFAVDHKTIEKITSDSIFKKHFGALKGDGVKTAPRGYDKDHEAIELIRMKQFIVSEQFTEKEALEKDFYLKVNASFVAMRPFFDYMSDVLTTNMNGELII